MFGGLTEPTEAALDAHVRPAMRNIKRPGASDAVFNDECMVSFDSPFSPGGLFVNLSTFQGFGADFLDSDLPAAEAAKTPGFPPTLYVHIQKHRVPRTDSDAGDRDGSSAGDASSNQAPTKMAIGVEGGFKTDEQKYETVTRLHLHSRRGKASATFALPDSRIPEYVTNVADAVAAHVSSAVATSATAWEEEVKVSKYAADLPLDESIASGAKKVVDIADPSAWECEDSGIKENLWLNLSDGYIGSGRKNWDGTGGTGAAKRHYEEVLATTGKSYPLVVKLGTITPDGKGDVYSYAKDEDDAVVDPHLPEHLARMGIDVKRLAKTEKSTAELAIELNLSYNFSEITEEGAALVPVRAANFVGLANLGNTCYVNSTLQCLMSLPEFREKYGTESGSVFAAAGKRLGLAPQDDLRLQLGKLAYGLYTERYVKMLQERSRELKTREREAAVNGSEGKDVTDGGDDDDIEVYVSPGALRTLLGKGHSSFSGPGQQDAEEFLRHMLDLFESSASKLYVDPAEDMSRLFRFCMQERLQTSPTEGAPQGRVKYNKAQSKLLRLSIPVDKIDNAEEVAAFAERESQKSSGALSSSEDGASRKEDEVEAHMKATGGQKRKRGEDGEQKEKPVLPNVPFSALLDAFAKPSTFEFRDGTATQTTRFADFPAYLWVHLARYTLDENTYQPVKLKHTVTPPLQLDLSSLKGQGLQPGEFALEEDDGNGEGNGSTSSGPEPDPSVVQAIVGMGFSENAGKRAALATNNTGAEAATNWLFGHMEDPDLNDPLPTSGSGGATTSGPDPAAVAQLCSMGMTPDQAKFALQQPGNEDPNNAVMWFFSNQDRLPELMAAAAEAEAKASSGAAAFETSKEADLKAREGRVGKFELVGFISHIGKNTGSGHYVCHLRKTVPGQEDKGLQWVIHNDRKVAMSKNPPLPHGYLYLYRCVE